MYLILSVNKGEGGKHMSRPGLSVLYWVKLDWITESSAFALCFPWLCPLTFTGLLLKDFLVKRVHLAWQQKEPWPTFPFVSISRHCCCEDEMSVLLKVQLKHNWVLFGRSVISQHFSNKISHYNFPCLGLMSLEKLNCLVFSLWAFKKIWCYTKLLKTFFFLPYMIVVK